jgi:CDP-glycerol glycerophosphotransferase (TagB/SpsB family)
VLVSPSWGASGLLSRFGKKLLDPLVDTGRRIIIRPHPQSKKSEAAMLEALEKRYAQTPNIAWDYEPENITTLAKAGIMISDFSGIIFDYIFLFEKPVIYVPSGMDLRPYDAHDLETELWQFAVLREIGFELKEEHFSSIESLIERISGSGRLKAAIQKAKDTAWQYRGDAGRRIADFMIEMNNKEDGELSNA